MEKSILIFRGKNANGLQYFHIKIKITQKFIKNIFFYREAADWYFIDHIIYILSHIANNLFFKKSGRPYGHLNNLCS